MSATILYFPDHNGGPVRPLPSTRDLALGNLRKAYHGACLGNRRSRAVVEVFAKAGDEEVSRLAQMLLAALDGRAVTAPCDIEPGGAS